jgi:hypothetical protein
VQPESKSPPSIAIRFGKEAKLLESTFIELTLTVEMSGEDIEHQGKGRTVNPAIALIWGCYRVCAAAAGRSVRPTRG